MYHKHPYFPQGTPYLLQTSSACENGSIAEISDN